MMKAMISWFHQILGKPDIAEFSQRVYIGMGKIWAESPGFDMEKLPGTQIHIILPLKPAPFATKSSAAFIGMEIDKDTPDITV